MARLMNEDRLRNHHTPSQVALVNLITTIAQLIDISIYHQGLLIIARERSIDLLE